MKTYQVRIWVEGWTWQEVETDDRSKVAELALKQIGEDEVLNNNIKIEQTDVDENSIKVIVDDVEESEKPQEPGVGDISPLW